MNLQEKRNDMITKEFDTIAAISTPLGEGAIGIVRLSGTDSFAIAQKIFKGKDLSKVASFSHHQIYFNFKFLFS